MAKKYIDAEKLIKSVNNYRKGARAALNPIDGDADYYTGKIDACEDIKEFITSLQQEQPEVDLEKEIKDTCREYRINESHEQELGKRDIENIAHYFYELGLNSRKEE